MKTDQLGSRAIGLQNAMRSIARLTRRKPDGIGLWMRRNIPLDTWKYETFSVQLDHLQGLKDILKTLGLLNATTG